MHDPRSAPSAAPAPERDGLAGLLMLAAAVVSIAFVALDPVSTGTDARSILQAMANNASMHRLVHVVEMACVFALAFGTASLARRLGLHRPAVRAGCIAHLAGSLLMLGAAIVDGFVTTDTATYFLGSGHDVEHGRELVHLCYAVLQDLAMTSWFLQSVGVLSLAAALVDRREPRAHRVAGAVGLATGTLPPIAIVLAYPVMDTGVVVGILVAQLAWNVAAALLLLRRATPAPRHAVPQFAPA